MFSQRAGVLLSESLAAPRHVCGETINTVRSRWASEPLGVRAEEHRPEHFWRDEELLVVQVFPKLSQVVHIRQLPPKLVTANREEEKKKNQLQRDREQLENFLLSLRCAQVHLYLIRGLKRFQTIRMKLVGWTTYRAFRFFLYLKHM